MSNMLVLMLVGLLMIPTATADEGPISEGQLSTTNYSESYLGNNEFNFEGAVSGGSSIDINGVAATKEILPSGKKNSPDVKLTLEMPPKPANLDIVLAMDTSGSMMLHYEANRPDTTFIDLASDRIKPLLKKYGDVRVSVVSWDDEDESGDSITPFFDATRDIVNIDNALNTLPKECLVTDYSVYSIGIKRAIQVLDDDSNWPADPYNTARVIILVTGVSEFRSEPKGVSDGMTLEDQLYSARLNRTYGTGSSFKGYHIFPVQIGIDRSRFKWQYNNLSKIRNNSNFIDRSLEGRPISIENTDELDGVIAKILDGLRSRPMAYDVRVIDTLYPYLNYTGFDSNWRIEPQLMNSSDGSTTLIWNIGNMSGSDVWTASIHTQLKLNLPVEVSGNKTRIHYEIFNTTPISEVRYSWITGYKGLIPLPEGQLMLSSPHAGDDAIKR